MGEVQALLKVSGDLLDWCCVTLLTVLRHRLSEDEIQAAKQCIF